MIKEYFNSLMIEPTNICNLSCPLCSIGSGRDKRPKGAMNFRQFKSFIHLTKDFLQFVCLWGLGEPFLAPDITKMINYASANNIEVEIHTNGVVLNKRIMDQFRNNPKMRISFSIDGATQKTYSYYRRGGQLKEVLENLSYLVNLKEKYRLSNITITWQFIIMRANEDEISAIYRMAKEIGVDKLKLKTIGIDKIDPRYNNFVPQNKAYCRQGTGFLTFEECYFIKPGMPVILWNGDIVPCCGTISSYTYNPEKYLMGNIFQKNSVDAWNSQKYKKFREDYENGLNEFCTKCKHNSKTSKISVKEINFNKKCLV